MNLSPADANLYYDLMLPLQLYAGRRAGLLTDRVDVTAYKDLPLERKIEVRDAMLAHREWIDAYCAENPDGRSDEELSILRGFRHARPGSFVIERYLAKHAILIDCEGKPKVYAVHGLLTRIDEMVPREMLPFMLKGALVPFKGRIVLDGLFKSYNVLLGSRIRAEYRETYLRAKQNGRIVERLEGDPWMEPGRSSGATAFAEGAAVPAAGGKPRKAGRPKKEHPDPVSLLNTVEAELERLAPRPTGSPAQKAAFALLKESVLMAKSTTLGYDMPGVLTVQWDSYNHVVKELRKVWRILKRASGEE